MRCPTCEISFTSDDINAEFAAHDDEVVDVKIKCAHCGTEVYTMVAAAEFTES